MTDPAGRKTLDPSQNAKKPAPGQESPDQARSATDPSVPEREQWVREPPINATGPKPVYFTEEPTMAAGSPSISASGPSSGLPSNATPEQGPSGQAGSSALTISEPSEFVPAPPAPGREPSTTEPALITPGQVSQDQAGPPVLIMGQCAFSPSPSLTGRLVKAGQPSNATPGKGPPGKDGPSGGPSMRKP